MATTVSALLSLAGVVLLGVQVHDVNQTLRQLKETSESAGKSARDAEAAVRAVESLVKNRAIQQDRASELSSPKPPRVTVRRGRKRK